MNTSPPKISFGFGFVKNVTKIKMMNDAIASLLQALPKTLKSRGGMHNEGRSRTGIPEICSFHNIAQRLKLGLRSS